MVLAVAVAAASCGFAPDSIRKLELEYIVIEAESGANGNNPIAVDFVFIYNEAMMQQVSGISAADWFQRRDQFKRDFPDGFRSWSWEIVPGQRIGRTEVPYQVYLDNAIASFVLARYYTPGDHRARILDETGVLVKLGQEDFVLQPLP